MLNIVSFAKKESFFLTREISKTFEPPYYTLRDFRSNFSKKNWEQARKNSIIAFCRQKASKNFSDFDWKKKMESHGYESEEFEPFTALFSKKKLKFTTK